MRTDMTKLIVDFHSFANSLKNSSFYPHSLLTCSGFMSISEQTAIFSLYSINWLGICDRDRVCLLRGTNCMFKYNSGTDENFYRVKTTLKLNPKHYTSCCIRENSVGSVKPDALCCYQSGRLFASLITDKVWRLPVLHKRRVGLYEVIAYEIRNLKSLCHFSETPKSPLILQLHKFRRSFK
jgi:hypothetical protein